MHIDRSLITATTDDTALEQLARRVLELGGRVLVMGAPGTGKSTLTRRLAATLAHLGPAPLCIGADPGSPGFGAPGATCLGSWRDGTWQLLRVEALCSLDAGRFRLPLVSGVRRLVPATRDVPLIVDGPGVVRGVAGAELLFALVEAASMDAVLTLERQGRSPPLARELRALDVSVLPLLAAEGAHRPGKPERARHRTRLWDAYLEAAGTHQLSVLDIPVLGTPPPPDAAEQWTGRQAALVTRDGRTAGFGEIEALEHGWIRLRCPQAPESDQSLLVRDARRDANGRLGTAGPDATSAVRYLPPSDVLPGTAFATGPMPVVRAGPITAVLANGVLGDPLLHLRLHHHRRSLLFDLGDAGRLSAKIAHQVSDVFLSHAHADHISGFLWLIRSRIGELPPVRVFGPPGIAGNVAGLLAGFHWDRVESRGPKFLVGEYDGEAIRNVLFQAGAPSQALESAPAPNGILLEEPGLRVRTALLDHGTPVLAFALETEGSRKVRKERLIESGLTPGPWLTRLKTLAASGDRDAPIDLPDGRESDAGTLADQLLLDAPGFKLTYATDLADTECNRNQLAALAADSHTLFCEASFCIADHDQAGRTGHLTTRACGEIATLARVQRLIPFHFSRRYEADLAPAYDEVRAAFSRTITPPDRDVPD